MSDRLFIALPRDLRYRDAVGALLQHICLRLERAERVEPRLGYQVVSAFNEAFNNVVQYGGSGPGEIEVLLELTPLELVLELRDAGPSFAFSEVAVPDLDQLPESGLGLYIIRACMSRVEYTPGGEGRKNSLRMVRELTRVADAAMMDPAEGNCDDA